MRRLTLIAIPYLWLLALFLVPFLIVLKISLSDTAIAIPPYTPTLDLSEGWAGFKAFLSQLDMENFTWLTQDDLYWKAYLSSVRIAFISTILTLIAGYPIAYAMARAAPESLGSAEMLDRYHRARITDIRARVTGITALNQVSMLKPPPLRDLRAAGLAALHGAAPLRRALMQLGLGQSR